MAHADYDCCAICDSKQSYNGGGAQTKEEICGPCVANLARLGHIFGTVAEFLEWVKTVDPKHLVVVLATVGYAKCFYDENPVDQAIDERIKALTSDPSITKKGEQG